MHTASMDLSARISRKSFTALTVLPALLEVFRGFSVVQRDKQIHTLPRVHPIENGFSLRRSSSHFRLVRSAHITLAANDVRVETHAATRHTVGIAAREDFEDGRPAHLYGDRICPSPKLYPA